MSTTSIDQHWDSLERENKRKGLIVSIVIHLLLLVLFIFIGLKYPFPPPAEEGILINFGTADAGSGNVQPEAPEEMVESVEEVTPPVEEAIPEVTQEEVLTQEVEEAPVIAEEPEEKTEPEEKKPVKEEVPAVQPEKVEEEKKPEPVKEPVKEEPKIDPNALYTGAKSETTTESKGEGEHIYKGDQGNPTGDPDATNYEGEKSTGLGDEGIGFDLEGRNMVFKPRIDDQSQKFGRVVIRIKVDRNGNVIAADYQLKGSTTSDNYLVSLARKAALQAKFNPSPNAPEVQVGTITFVFKPK